MPSPRLQPRRAVAGGHPHSVRLSGPKLSTEGRSGGALDRLVPLVEAVEPERITATLQDGLLTVDLPKAAWVQGKARRVPINADPSVATAQHKEQPDNHA
ncbi:Hsp20/alpha crystallin family protein [Jiella pacifica]|uniref:Hsp20/alpha crystallin family protein n=1 Tax=Jiella pacifica TaxID=2696469 RepID=UPI0035E44272